MKKIPLTLFLSFLAIPLLANNIDSLYTAYQQKTGMNKVDVGRQLIRQFIEEEYYDYPVSPKFANDRKFSSMLLNLGMSIYEYERNDFAKAVKHAHIAEEFCHKDSLQWLCSCYELLNVSYQRRGDYTKALYYAQKDYELGKKLQDNDIQSNALNSLAAIHCSTNHLEDALRYIDKAIAIERQNKKGNGKSLAIRLGSKCEILSLMNRPEEALACINEALAIDSSANRMDKVGIRMSQKAEILMKEQRWEECREICLEALGIFGTTERLVDKAITLKQLGQCELSLHNLDAAAGYLYCAEKLCQKLGFKPLLWKTQYLLHQVYREKKDYQKALNYLELSSTNKDSLNREEFDKIIGEYKVKYETNEKEQQLKLKEITLRNRNILSIVLACLILLVCISTLIGFRLAAVRKKRNRELAELNSMKDQLFSIISHDLKNPVASQKQVIDSLYNHFDDIGDLDKKEQITALKLSHDSLHEMLLNLLGWASLESGRVTYKPIRTDISALVRRSIQIVSPAASHKNITISQHIPSDCIVNTDRNFILTILHNILSNAIKFSYEGGSIEITADTSAQDTISISVTDHGIGMTEDQLSELFQRNESTPGTLGEKGTGIGLLVCRKLVEQGREKISVTSTPELGSTFILTLNKPKQS